MRFVFVMDSLDRVDVEKDTTYGFIEAAVARGHRCEHCLVHHVERVAGDITAVTRTIAFEAGKPLRFAAPPTRVALADVDAVFIRKDPPFDQAYSYATLLLELLRDRTLVLNDPRGLREANEKLYTLHFSSWMPQTMVSFDREAIHSFVAQIGGRAVIKPLDGAGGFGVLAVTHGDPNARGIVDLLTNEGRNLAMVQEYLPAIAEGDKRVLVLDGEPLGAILRVPKKGDLRANIHVGGEVVATELSAREIEMVQALAPRLRADGLTFVGLDLIGERLTEINVTSPTGIRELSRFVGRRVSDDVIAWVEDHAAG